MMKSEPIIHHPSSVRHLQLEVGVSNESSESDPDQIDFLTV